MVVEEKERAGKAEPARRANRSDGRKSAWLREGSIGPTPKELLTNAGIRVRDKHETTLT